MTKILVSVKNMPKACVLYEYVVRKMKKTKTKIQTKSSVLQKKKHVNMQDSLP